MWTFLATFVLIVLVMACLYWARTVLIPVAIAILLTFLLSPVVTLLQRKGLGRIPSVLLVVIVAGIALTGLGWLILGQMTSLAGDLPTYEENIKRKVADLREMMRGGPFEKAARTFEEVSKELGKEETPADDQAINQRPIKVIQENQEKPSPFAQIGTLLGPFLEPLAQAGLVAVLVAFMLISREDLRNRLISMFGQGRITVTTKALDDAAQRISRYLLMQLIINASFGLCIGIGLFLIGVPYGWLWGFLAAVLRYIPYVGPWLAAVLPITLSLLVFEGWFQPLLVIGLFLVSELFSNLVMEPWLYGQSIGVSEAALLIAVAFWTWLWGPVGLILATPLTVCLVVLGKYVPHLRFFDVLLGDQPGLTPEIQFYQRLLARDEDEAVDIVEEQLRTMPLEQVYDELVLPALLYTKRDLEDDKLTEDEAEYIWHALRDIVEEQDIGKHRGEEATPDGPAAGAGEPRLLILGCPARDEADEVAMRMLQQIIEGKTWEVEMTSSHQLASEIIALVEEKSPAVVCIAALPPGGLAQARLLCLRLHGRFPKLKIVVGRWGLRANLDKNREQLLAAGAEHFATTLRETRNQLIQLGQLLPHLEEQDEKEKPDQREVETPAYR
jgi:predicted PurR-regulated permease PerM